MPVCLDPRPRLMRGIGEKLSAPLDLPPLPAVLVNPGVALATKTVFAGWKPAARVGRAVSMSRRLRKLASRKQLLQLLAAQPNDLEGSAIALAPVIAEVLAELARACRLPAGPHVGLGRDLLRPFLISSRKPPPRRKPWRGKYPDWWVARRRSASAAATR